MPQIKCEYCNKFAALEDVTKFPPYRWIHTDEHGCLCQHIQSLNDGQFNKLAGCVAGEVLRPLLKVME